MPITLGNNIASLTAQRMLSRSVEAGAKASERLASGLRINRGADDAAGLAVSTKLRSDARVYSHGLRNINDAVSALSIAESALHELQAVSTRQQELAQQAANGTYSNQQRRALHEEAKALSAEHNRIVASTSFNRLKLLDGSLSDLRVQLGYGLDGSLSLALGAELTREVGNGTFGSSNSLTVGVDPQGLATGDLNGDGHLDLVSTDYSPNTLSVLLGNGDGSFQARQVYNGNTDPYGIILADVNSDGRLDAITADSDLGTDSVSIFLGNGNGSFGAAISYAAGAEPIAVRAADLNGDGKLDLALSNSGSASVSILLGNGNGSFRARVSYSTGTTPRDVALEDLNGDGRIDLLSTDAGSNQISIRLGLGDGSFGTRLTLSTQTNPYAISIDDIDLDGYQDLLVAEEGTNTVSIRLGNGDATFSSAVSYAVGTSPYDLQVADFNDDGFSDFATASFGPNTASVYLGRGDGTFSATGSFATGTDPYALVTGDFNEDGALDIATANQGPNTLGVLLANTSLSAQVPTLNLMSQEGAREAFDTIAQTQARISNELSSIGGHQSRLQYAASTLASMQENHTAAASRILDADVASEVAELVRQQILQRAATAVLAQANASSGLVLSLLGAR